MKDDDDDHLIMAGDQVVIRSNGNFSWDDGLRKDMTRAAACVNALEGIANPEAVANVIDNLRSIIESFNNKELAGWEIEVARKALADLDAPVPKTEEEIS